MTRTFIAVRLPDAIRVQLALQIETLKPRLPAAVRWVAPESLHLTLARIKEPLRPDTASALPDLLRAVPAEHGSWQVRELCVMKSDLARSGPTRTAARYTCLHAYPLEGSLDLPNHE